MSDGPYDYFAEREDALRHDRTITDERWNGTRHSEVPEPADYADLGGDR